MSDSEISFKNVGRGDTGPDLPSTSAQISINQEEFNIMKDSVEMLKAQSKKFNEFIEFMMATPSTNPVDESDTASVAEPDISFNSSEILASASQEEMENPLSSDNTEDPTDPFRLMLEKYSNKEKLGKPVNDNLAELVDMMMTHQQSSEQIKDIKKNIVRPENTKFLVAPQINKEIWEMIPQDMQQADVKFQKIQQNLVQGITPIVECLDMKSIPEEIRGKLMNSLTLLSHAQMELNLLRRGELKPKMKSAKGLVHRDVPITSQLFGDDLEGEIKKMEQKKKLASSVASTSTNADRQRRFHPYASSFQNFKDKARSFLGKDGLLRQGFQPQFQQSRQQYSQRSYQNQSYKQKGYRGKKKN